MSDDKIEQDACSLDLQDDAGDTNLCCCYVMGSDGDYEDPCYTPVEACCC